MVLPVQSDGTEESAELAEWNNDMYCRTLSLYREHFLSAWVCWFLGRLMRRGPL